VARDEVEECGVWHVHTAHVSGVTESRATSLTKPICVNPTAHPLRLQHVSAEKTDSIGRHAPPTGPLVANERSGPPGYVLPGVNYYRLTDSTVVVHHRGVVQARGNCTWRERLRQVRTQAHSGARKDVRKPQ
jgi:hypothetical protein